VSILGLADCMFASLTDSTPTGSAFTSEPNPPGIASSRLLRAEENIERVLRAVLSAEQVAQQEVGTPILPLHCASEQPKYGLYGSFSLSIAWKERTNWAKYGQNSPYDPFSFERRTKCTAGSRQVV
jgi:hypothetical protein